MEPFKNDLDTYPLKNGDSTINVIIGCSGGPDSMCLLYLMHVWSLKYGHIKPIAVTVDHKLREAGHFIPMKMFLISI
jgi:tRNA(Ile)-lysidine synthase TilS/MesJ